MRLSTTAFSKPCAPCCFARKISAVPPSAILRRMVYRACRLIRAGSPAAQGTTRSCSPGRLPRLGSGPVRRGVWLAVSLTRLHGDLETVLVGRERTGRVRRERAGRRVGAVEVDDERTVRLAQRPHEAPAAVALVRRRQIAEHDHLIAIIVAVEHGVEPQRFSEQRELERARALERLPS